MRRSRGDSFKKALPRVVASSLVGAASLTQLTVDAAFFAYELLGTVDGSWFPPALPRSIEPQQPMPAQET